MDEFSKKSFESNIVFSEENFYGTSLWHPPGFEFDETVLYSTFESIPKDRLENALKFFEEFSEYHPDDAWYLAFISVDPSKQGLGIGSFLLKEALKMVDEKKEERARQSIISRGPEGSWNPFSKGFYVGAAKFGTGLAVSMLDPINIGASFIPVFGQARFAALAARQGLRTARLTRGVVEGAVGAALVEPIVYSAAKRVQADYGAADSLLNIAFGSILGLSLIHI